MRSCDRTALAVLLGRDTGIRTRRVHERDQRKAVSVRQLHRAHRLAVSLGMRGAEVAVDAVLDVAPLLLADERDRATVEASDPGDDRVVVRATAVAVELEPVVDEPLDVVERVRPVLVPRELDAMPDVLVGRLLSDALELTLQLLDLCRHACAAEEVDAAQAREALSQPELLISRHSSRTDAVAGRPARAARIEARPCRCARTGSSTRTGRSRRGAFHGWSVERRVGRRTTSAHA